MTANQVGQVPDLPSVTQIDLPPPVGQVPDLSPANSIYTQVPDLPSVTSVDSHLPAQPPVNPS